MNTRAFKYLSPITIYVLAYFAFKRQGIVAWSPMIYAWIIIPIVELLIKPDEKNMPAAEEELDGVRRGFAAADFRFVLR